MASGIVYKDQVIKSAKITLTSASISAGSGMSFYLTQNDMPSDFHSLLAIIPISVGPEGWGSTVPAVITTVSISDMSLYVRAYATGNYAPIITILYT